MQLADIVIHKKSEYVPKDTKYEFPYEIKAPIYGDEVITRSAEITDEGALGGGKMYSVELDMSKYKKIESIDLGGDA